MKTYLGHLIHSTWFTLTWEAALALLVFFSGIGISLTGNGYLKVMGVLAAVSALIALACIPLVELTKTYWKTLYRDQGMFTHTLPIAKGKIFAAHGIWFSICSFIFGGIFCLAIFSWIIIIKGSPSLAALVEIKQALYTYKGAVFFYLTSFIISSICGSFTFLASISVGMHSKLYGRLGIAAPVLAVVLIILIQQILTVLGGLFLPGVWDPQRGVRFNSLIDIAIAESGHTHTTINGGLPLGIMLAYIPFTIFICYLAVRFLNRNLSVNG